VAEVLQMTAYRREFVDWPGLGSLVRRTQAISMDRFMNRDTPVDQLPTLRAIPLTDIGDGLPVKLLTPRQRQDLTAISTRLNIPARGTVYREDAKANAVFICAEGALKAFRELPSGKRRVTAFLYADDVFGLSESGRYVNTVQALTPTVCFRVPLEGLTGLIRKDAELGLNFICKLVHELRSAQLRLIIMGRRSAKGRIAMFLLMLQRHLAGHSQREPLPLPMSRSDIAGYLGLSLETVSRAGKQLVNMGLIAFASRNSVRILDRPRLEQMARNV
jgi:CRP/FNR family transcriptional regulator, anaerobic regulatory protein